MKIVHPIIFMDKLVKNNELGQPFTLMDHQREILRLAFDFDKDGRLPWDTILSHDDTDSWDLVEMLEELLGGRWDAPATPWESRKDAMLELLAKERAV